MQPEMRPHAARNEADAAPTAVAFLAMRTVITCGILAQRLGEQTLEQKTLNPTT